LNNQPAAEREPGKSLLKTVFVFCFVPYNRPKTLILYLYLQKADFSSSK
jgi:hypothetical protein